MFRNTKRRRTALAAAVATSLVLAACGDDDGDDAASDTSEVTSEDTAAPPATGSDTAPADTVDVSIAADGFLLGTPAWISQEEGYFADNGVEADVALFGTGIEAIQGVIARQADLGHALDFAVLNLVAAADENMEIVGAIAAPEPGFHSLAVQNDINGPEDLVGTTIGYVEGTSEHFVTLSYLEQNGISVDDVELVPLPGLFELVGALKTNEIQAAWVWLDGTAEADADPNLTILGDDSNVLDTVAIYLIAEAGWADENEDSIERVLRSYNDASAFIADDPAGAAVIVADSVSGDAEVFEQRLPDQNFRVEMNQTMLDSLDSIAAFLIERGTLEADFDVRQFIDLEAMERAVPGSVTADLN